MAWRRVMCCGLSSARKIVQGVVMVFKKRGTYQDGLRAERRALWVLRLKGYRILAQRYKTPVGEIDIVARRGRVVAFVEVKYRGSLAAALQSVTPAMQGRIVNAARHFIAAYPQYNDYVLRFDLMAVSVIISFRHLDNAWAITA